MEAAGSGRWTVAGGESGKKVPRDCDLPKVSIRGTLSISVRPRRAARPDPTRAWIQIVWSVDNVNRAFVAATGRVGD